MAEYVAVSLAAELAGVPARTIRNWVAAGKLPALPGKGGKRVDVGAVRQLASRPGKGAASVPANAELAGGKAGDVPGLAEALALVERLTQQNLEMAGRLGFYQARVQDLEARVELLSAGPDLVVNSPPSDGPVSANLPERGEPPGQRPQGRAWWRFWRRPSATTATAG